MNDLEKFIIFATLAVQMLYIVELKNDNELLKNAVAYLYE